MSQEFLLNSDLTLFFSNHTPVLSFTLPSRDRFIQSSPGAAVLPNS